MKVRLDFVTNSSSVAYVVTTRGVEKEKVDALLRMWGSRGLKVGDEHVVILTTTDYAPELEDYLYNELKVSKDAVIKQEYN